MEFLKKLFGLASDENGKSEPKDVSVEVTSKMLDEDRFWDLVEGSLEESFSQEGQEQFLIRFLEDLEPEDMIGFRLRTDKLLYDSYTSDLWCAAYIINGGCSDDSFEYFRLWLISRGREAFEKCVSNPDDLVDFVTPDESYYEFETFWYVALKAFENKTGKELYDYIDYDNFKTMEGNYPQFEFTWEEDDPESMKRICPKLFEKYDWE